MRRLFIVLAKILGLYQFYWILITFMSLCFSLGVISGGQVCSLAGTVIGMVISLVLSLGVAWVLVLRTNWLADILNLKEEGESVEFKEEAILRTGIKLIGVYVTVYAIPSFAKLILNQPMFYLGMLRVDFWTELIPPAMQLALGVYMAIRSDSVLVLAAKAEKIDARRILWVGLGFFAVMVVLGLAVTQLRTSNYIDSYTRSGSVVDDNSKKYNKVLIPKETNTLDAGYWQTTPGWQPQTNVQKIQIKAD